MVKALRNSKVCVAVVGPSKLGPSQEVDVSEGIAQLVNKSKQNYPIITVILPGAHNRRLPTLLDKTQWIVFREGVDFDEEAFQKLVTYIRYYIKRPSDDAAPNLRSEKSARPKPTPTGMTTGPDKTLGELLADAETG
jgi:hypothetical protein